MGRDDLTIEYEEGCHGGVRLLVVDPATARPFSFAGAVEAALDRTSTATRLTIEPVDAWRFELHVTWGGEGVRLT